jgi:hypothetical protein
MASSEPKTQPTKASVASFINGVQDEARRKDCQALVKLMQKATGEKAVMWGTAIVGFGTYRYTYASGRSGDWPILGFSPRKNDLTLYVSQGFAGCEALLARLGKHKTGKVCLYLKKLSDADPAVLEELLAAGVQAMSAQRVFPDQGT